MANQTGLLEPAFAELLQNASDSDLLILNQGEMPDELPSTETEVVAAGLEAYREYQTLIDAAVQGATAFLSTAEGMAQLKALETAAAAGAMDLGRSITDHMLEDDSFAALRNESAFAKLAAAGIGIAGDSFNPKGFGAGAEWIYYGNASYRVWLGGEFLIGAGKTFGLSFSFWQYTPSNGVLYAFCLDTPITPTIAPILPNVRMMVCFQRIPATKKIRPAGLEIQIGIGTLVYPTIGGFIGYQFAKKHSARAKLSVKNNGSNTFQINTATTLSVKITAEVELFFNSGSIVKLNLPNYFTQDDMNALTFSNLPGYWDQTIDGQNIVFTANKDYEWTGGQTITFDISNVNCAPEENQDANVLGIVTLTGQPDTTAPVVATSNLYLALQTFNATITSWTATQGSNTDDDLTLTGDCTGQSTCSGQNVAATSQGGTEVTQLATAVDSDGNTWILGYQFNYDDDGTSARIRTAIYQDGAGTSAIYASGNWTDYSSGASGSDDVSYQRTNGNTNIAISFRFT
ncbi:MAG TPA: hypothetical protein VGQ76_23720 [Thermoanaerobaculia bacterium]|jgi:hypothetical protein|nr:hypothetical protein [Thermoanaerobaculia bacterium]